MNYPFPSNQRSGYVYLFFLPIDFASIFIVFLISKMADLMALYEIPPPSPHPVNLTCFFAAIWFLSFCRFQRWRTLQRHMNYPFPSNQRSGYVYLFFLPIDFASIFIVFSFSKMADIRRHMKYPWLESTLSTFWPLKYTPTPLSVFFIWFDVIRMPRKADSHAPHVWLAWLARLTRLPRMPRWLVPYTNSCNFTNEGQKSLQRIVLQTANIRS